jgi:hypothetical protein
MTRTRAALAEQTALAEHYASQVDDLRRQLAEAQVELAVVNAVGTALLVRNAELAAREPVQIVVQGRDALAGFGERVDLVLRELEMGEGPA